LGTALLAVVLSLVVWVNATYQNDRPREDIFPEAVPIQVQNVPSDLVVVNDPDEYVRVKIKAFESSWARLTANSFQATVDLQGLGEGLHTVPVEVTCNTDRTVSIISSQPEKLNVRLDHLRTETMDITVQMENRDDLPLGYAVGVPVVEPSTVTVEGAGSAVDRVAAVAAPVSLAGQRTALERTVDLFAVDEDGRRVNDVRLNPQTVTVQVNIEKKLNYREVAVRARTTGHPARGYFVSSVEVEPSTVTVVGPPTAIAEMSGLISTRDAVDVSGATRMLAERLELELPEGVSVLAEGERDPQTVLVTVGIDAVVGGTTVELPLQTRKLGDGLTAKLSVSSVDVILTGPAVLLDNLEIELLNAYVDLSGLGVGTHQVKTLVDIMVAKNPVLADIAVTSVSPAYVEADIQVAPTPTPEPTATPDAAAETTPTPTSRSGSSTRS
jgi:YbbR domain-containing protein